MIKNLLTLLLLVLSFQSFSGGIPFKTQSDEFYIGKKESADAIEMFFDVGDGLTNPVLSVDKTDKTFVFSKQLVSKAGLTVGSGFAGDNSIIIDEGAGVNNPRITWDTTENKWKHYDGTTERKFGAGTGGGADAVNILAEFNPDAEDGILNWTYSGIGSFTTVTNLNEVHSGERSFITDFNAQLETVKSSERTIPQGLYGQACQARFFYIGGDNSVAITATVRNGNDDIVYGSQSKVLTVANIWSVVDLFFLCPNATEIAGDAQLANLYLQFEQTGVGNAATFKFDKVHLGGLIGLVETATPDTIGFIIDEGTLISESSEIIDSVTYVNSSTATNVTFKTGLFTQIPSIVSVVDVESIGSVGKRTVSIYNVTTSGFTFVIENSTPLITQAFPVHFSLTKQGVDAKQSVQVYKSVPRVAENINEFSAQVSVTGVVSKENVDWITGDCGVSDTSLFNCTINAGVFSLVPNCFIQVIDVNGQTDFRETTSTATSIRYRTSTSAGDDAQRVVSLFCQKRGTDYKTPTVQPILVNQVQTANQRGITENGCRVNNSGTATISSGSGLCADFVDSVNRSVLGRVTVNFVAGLYPNEPVCNVISLSSGNVNTEIQTISTSSVLVATFTANSGADVDANFQISCKGVR